MTKQVIITSNSPDLPFSRAIKAGNYVFISGQVGDMDPKTGEAVRGIEGQTKQCLEKIRGVLEAAGLNLDDVVKVTVFLRNTDDFAKMNEVYRRYFTENPPARSTIITGLVRPSMLIEVECIAYNL